MSLLDAVSVLQWLLIEQETLGEITITPLTYPRGKVDAQASYFLQGPLISRNLNPKSS